jgi:succinate dehydrogenase / fumarate reductase cytochrome b subunit
MTGSDVRPRLAPAPSSAKPTAQEPNEAIESSRTGDKASILESAAAPLGSKDGAVGGPDTSDQAVNTCLDKRVPRVISTQRAQKDALALRPRPSSPNIQIYRPQLTSVLSITNRITGIALSLGAVGLVAWLLAAASGPQAYAAVQGAISTWIGQVALFGFTLAFFLHLCGGIRHLVWDTVHAFDLRSIYLGGWMVVVASVVLTIAAWIASFFMAG